MPYLDIKLSGPCLPDNVTKLAARMSDLAADILHKRREVTAATVLCVPSGHWSIGGAPISASGQTSFFLEINVTTGTNTVEEKAAFVAAAFEGAQAVLGRLAPASYVIVRDVPAEAWGYAGVTQEARRLQRAVKEPA
ncbi:MAG: tautomerase family protein [Ignavibacteria bacterium]